MDDEKSQARLRRLLGDQLKIRHLRLLELIARLGSLTAAAQELHLTQPAVTHMLKDLEAALGIALVERDRRGGRLTAAGQAALERLRVALGHIDIALDEVPAQAPQLLRVAMLPMFAMDLLPRTVARFERLGVRLRLQIREDTVEGVVRRLLDGEVDCALGALEGLGLAAAAERRLRAQPLHEEEPKIVCAPTHPLARRRSVDLRTLATLEWVLLPPDTATRNAFDALFLGAGIDPPPATIESASFHTNLNLVASTRLCSFVPASTMMVVVPAGQLHELRIGDATLGNRPLALYTLAGTPPFPALQRFIDAVLDSVPRRAPPRSSRTRA